MAWNITKSFHYSSSQNLMKPLLIYPPSISPKLALIHVCKRRVNGMQFIFQGKFRIGPGTWPQSDRSPGSYRCVCWLQWTPADHEHGLCLTRVVYLSPSQRIDILQGFCGKTPDKFLDWVSNLNKRVYFEWRQLFLFICLFEIISKLKLFFKFISNRYVS